MNRDQKIKEVEALRKKFESAKAIVFAQNKGLKVSEVTELRKTLAKEKASLKVVKNRLLKRALNALKIAGLEPYIDGSVTIAASEEDPVVPAKILTQFIKEHEALAIQGGWIDGKVFTSENIRALANLPSREVLYSMLLRCLQGPATGFAGVLAAIPRQLVTAIDGIRKQKE